MSSEDVRRVQVYYPQIWYATHRHPPETGLSEREGRILAHLAAPELTSPRALAAHLGVGASTLSEGVDGLVERHLVRRVRRDDDRRKIELELTEKGAALLERSSPLDAARVERVLTKLSPEERKRAVDGLALLARACRDVTLEDTGEAP